MISLLAACLAAACLTTAPAWAEDPSETPAPTAEPTTEPTGEPTPSPTPTESATAAPAPTLGKATSEGRKTVGKVSLTYSYSLPQLSGATSTATAKFDKAVAAIVTAAEKRATTSACKKGSGGPAEADLKIHTNGGIYLGRYASVTLVTEAARPYCKYGDYGVPQSVTIDLKAAKTVTSVSTFARQEGGFFDAAAVASLRAYNKCDTKHKLKAAHPPLVKPTAWNVTSKGVDLWWGGSASKAGNCSVIRAHVDWKYILKPADIAGSKSVTTYWVDGVEEDKAYRSGYTGTVAVVRVTGSRIAVLRWNLASNSGYCQVGVTSGKKALTWRTTRPWSRFSVALKGSGAKAVPSAIAKAFKKASAGQRSALFTGGKALAGKFMTKECKL
jgi:hypothetical protein